MRQWHEPQSHNSNFSFPVEPLLGVAVTVFWRAHRIWAQLGQQSGQRHIELVNSCTPSGIVGSQTFRRTTDLRLRIPGPWRFSVLLQSLGQKRGVEPARVLSESGAQQPRLETGRPVVQNPEVR